MTSGSSSRCSQLVGFHVPLLAANSSSRLLPNPARLVTVKPEALRPWRRLAATEKELTVAPGLLSLAIC